MGTKEKSLLEEAAEIFKERSENYPDPIENFKDISELASFLSKKEITTEDCIIVLIALKLCRERYKHQKDNLADLINYIDFWNKSQS